MRLYYARFTFIVDDETGNSGLYYPTLRSLKADAAEIVCGRVDNDSESLQYHYKPLGPEVDGFVSIEIRVEVERIVATNLTRGLFCSAVNNAGNAGFVKERVALRPLIFQFKVPAELFEEQT